jgi:hypothetical protein
MRPEGTRAGRVFAGDQGRERRGRRNGSQRGGTEQRSERRRQFFFELQRREWRNGGQGGVSWGLSVPPSSPLQPQETVLLRFLRCSVPPRCTVSPSAPLPLAARAVHVMSPLLPCLYGVGLCDRPGDRHRPAAGGRRQWRTSVWPAAWRSRASPPIRFGLCGSRRCSRWALISGSRSCGISGRPHHAATRVSRARRRPCHTSAPMLARDSRTLRSTNSKPRGTDQPCPRPMP